MLRWFDGAARRVGAAASAARFAVRSFGPFDTNPVPAAWTHVTKLDPEEEKRLPLLYHRYLRHTDAVSVGGSADVTADNTAETLALLGAVRGLPVFHEPSAAHHVDERTRATSDFLAIPEVLNGDAEALVGTLGRGAEYVKRDLAPEALERKLPGPVYDRWGDRLADFATWWLLADSVFEGYLIQNPDSAAAREGNVSAADVLSPAEARRRALAAERHLSSEVVYVEYSGTFGGQEAVDVVAAVDDATSWSRVWYGGGLDSRANARKVLDAGADTVVVGDVFHDVADDERRCYERARTALDATAGGDAVRSWLAEAVAVEETAAHRYLSTIPSVADPRERAVEYLADAVHVALWVERRRDGQHEGGEAGSDLETTLAALADGREPGEGVPPALAAETVRSWAAHRVDGTAAGSLGDAVRHVGSLPVGRERTAE